MSDLVKRLRVLSFEDAREGADRIEALEAALRQAREALADSYDVTSWPANGQCSQDHAIAAINDLLKD
jgi:hypothetical protein